MLIAYTDISALALMIDGGRVYGSVSKLFQVAEPLHHNAFEIKLFDSNFKKPRRKLAEPRLKNTGLGSDKRHVFVIDFNYDWSLRRKFFK